MFQYLDRLESIVTFCKEFKKDGAKFAFKKTNGNQSTKPYIREYCWTPRYQQYWQTLQGIIEVSDMLGIETLDSNVKGLKQRAVYLNSPDMINTKKRFLRHIDWITTVFEYGEAELKTKLLLLDK